MNRAKSRLAGATLSKLDGSRMEWMPLEMLDVAVRARTITDGLERVGIDFIISQKARSRKWQRQALPQKTWLGSWGSGAVVA